MHPIQTREELINDISSAIKELIAEQQALQKQIDAKRELEMALFVRAIGEGIYDDVVAAIVKVD